MLFEIGQTLLAVEDFVYKGVSPLLCAIILGLAIWQGGGLVLASICLFSIGFIPAILKQWIGLIDVIFLGVYTGLLADLMSIAYFYLFIGCFGVIWYLWQRTSAPMITLMGLSYSMILIKNSDKINI